MIGDGDHVQADVSGACQDRRNGRRAVIAIHGVDVQISKSLDAEYGLDQQAIKAAKQWKFKPGTREGTPVAVEVTIEMTFTLKK